MKELISASLDSEGEITWQKLFGDPVNGHASYIQQTTDGGYIFAGTYRNDHSRRDFWFVKLDSEGEMTWQKLFGGSETNFPSSFQQTTDGGYIFAGTSNGEVIGNRGMFDYLIVKFDSEGELVWQKSLGGSDADRAYAIQQTSDGGYIIAGHSSSRDGDVSTNHGGRDYWIVKLQP